MQKWADRADVVGVRLFGVAAGCSWVDDPDRATGALRAIAAAGPVAGLTVFAHQLEDLFPIIGKK